MRWMILVGLLLVACGDDDGRGRDSAAPDSSMDSAIDTGGIDSGSDTGAEEDTGSVDTGSVDSGSADTGSEDTSSADTGSADTGSDTNADIGSTDAMTDAMSTEAICSFNSDCVPTERCECEAGECLCRIGTRGTGAAGVDPCTDGNDCASSVCAEGNGGAFYCSGECATAADCGPELPRCIDVAFVGRICARDPG